MVSRRKLRRADYGLYEYRGEQPPAEAPVGQGGKKKNTRRWCKGVVGREHALEHVQYRGQPCRIFEWGRPGHRWANLLCAEADVCTVCGKVLNRYRARDCRLFAKYTARVEELSDQ